MSVGVVAGGWARVSVGVTVDAKPDAVAFYESLGFFQLKLVAGEIGDRPQPLPMFFDLGQLSGAR